MQEKDRESGEMGGAEGPLMVHGTSKLLKYKVESGLGLLMLKGIVKWNRFI